MSLQLGHNYVIHNYAIGIWMDMGYFFITSTAPSKQMDIVFNIWGFKVTCMEVIWNLDYAHVLYIYISLSLCIYI